VKRDKFKIDRTEKGKRKRTFQNVEFASEMEMKFYRDYLLPLKEKGEINEIILQPKYVLQNGFTKNGKKYLPIIYVGDFEVDFSDKKKITYDVKGLPTPEAKMKRKIFEKIFPEKILIWIALSMQDGGWIEFDKLQKLRAKRKKERNNA
jgi:hypothetical protein